MRPQYLNVTDRQDGQLNCHGNAALRVASRGKYEKNHIKFSSLYKAY